MSSVLDNGVRRPKGPASVDCVGHLDSQTLAWILVPDERWLRQNRLGWLLSVPGLGWWWTGCQLRWCRELCRDHLGRREDKRAQGGCARQLDLSRVSPRDAFGI